MPRVGNKHFPYTKAGYAAAAKAKKAKGFHDGGTAKLTAEEKKELQEIIDAQNRENRQAQEERREQQSKVDRGNWEGQIESESTNFKKGGKVRKNHKGCGCVMEGRRKKTLYT